MIAPRLAGALLVLCPFTAIANPAPESPAEVVRRTTQVMTPAHLACHVETDVQVFDKSGKPTDHIVIRSEEIRTGATRDERLLSVLKNGKDETAEAEAKRKKDKAKKKDEELTDPFVEGGASHYEFRIIGREMLWQHPVIVMKITAREKKPALVDGTAWIDAERYLVLKSEYEHAKLPDHVHWMKMQSQSEMREGKAVPTLFKVDGAGGFLLIERSFNSISRWHDCK